MRFIEADNVLPERTSISNLFFSTFLPSASGNEIKVYLYSYFLMRNRMMLTDDEFRETLGLSQDEIDRAFNYWVKEGIIEKGDDGEIVFYDVDSLTIKNLAKAEKMISSEPSPEENLIKLNRDPEIRNFFNSCDHIVRRQLIPEEKKRLISWMQEYNMDTEMVLHAMSLTYDVKNIKNLDYVRGILRRWHDQGKVTLDEVIDDQIENSEFDGSSHIETVRKSLNMKHRDLTDAAIRVIDRWKYDYGFGDEVIALACAQTVNIREPNIAYVNAIMENWYESGVKTVEDAMNLLKNKPRATYQKPGSFDFDKSRQTDEYDEDDLKALLGWDGEL